MFDHGASLFKKDFTVVLQFQLLDIINAINWNLTLFLSFLTMKVIRARELSLTYCHTLLHLGFSAKLKIWQVPICKMEPGSGFKMYQKPPTNRHLPPTCHPPATHSPIHNLKIGQNLVNVYRKSIVCLDNTRKV